MGNKLTKKDLDRFWKGMTAMLEEANDWESIVIADVLERCPQYLGVLEVSGENTDSGEK